VNGNPLRARGSLVDALSSALDRGGHGLSNAPTLLRRLLSEGSWREFETVRGETVRYNRFTEFVTTAPLKGLGTDIDLVRRIVKDDPEVLDLLDRSLQRPASAHALYNIQGSEAPTGTSREASLRRLRKDRPDLHAEVLEGSLSAHAAMVQAGFRRRTVSVPVDRPDAVAKTLRKNLSPEDYAEVVRLLSQPS
jgi:hypothetical protein